MTIYYKPQSPIQSGEDFIYPLTTSDQVMVDENTRLNAVGVYLENIDNSTDTTVYGNNATTLGGVAAEDYALKTDTAPDSAKLGGVAASDYVLKTDTIDNAANANQLNGYSLNELLSYIYPVGSTYTTATNSNPSSYLGGTWTLVDKKLAARTYSNTAVFTVNSSNATLSGATAVVGGHEIRIRMQVKNVAAWADTQVDIGTINFANLGISGIDYTLYLLGQGDAANVISLAMIHYQTGLLSYLDCITKTSGGSLAASNTIYYDFNIIVPYSKLVDSFCDQFVWKRTA